MFENMKQPKSLNTVHITMFLISVRFIKEKSCFCYLFEADLNFDHLRKLQDQGVLFACTLHVYTRLYVYVFIFILLFDILELKVKLGRHLQNLTSRVKH